MANEAKKALTAVQVLKRVGLGAAGAPQSFVNPSPPSRPYPLGRLG